MAQSFNNLKNKPVPQRSVTGPHLPRRSRQLQQQAWKFHALWIVVGLRRARRSDHSPASQQEEEESEDVPPEKMSKHLPDKQGGSNWALSLMVKHRAAEPPPPLPARPQHPPPPPSVCLRSTQTGCCIWSRSPLKEKRAQGWTQHLCPHWGWMSSGLLPQGAEDLWGLLHLADSHWAGWGVWWRRPEEGE